MRYYREVTQKFPPLCVDDVIITDELSRRPARIFNPKVEAEALGALVKELAEQPENLLQKLVDTLIGIGIADSAGISMLEEAEDDEQFRWVALAGQWGQYKGGVMPFDASPCGVVIKRDEVLLFEHPERFFPAAAVEPLIHEILLVPFHAGGRTIGTVWINAHDPGRKFDAEDVRLLRLLSGFASAGYQMKQALGDARAGEAASRAALEADLAGMRRLHDLQTKLATENDPGVALDEILAAACEFTATDRGCVQLVSDDGERLEIFAQRGYGPDSPFIRHFLHEGSKPACDAARSQHQRMIIEDVENFPLLLGTQDREVALTDGIRATQSTPIISREGETLGVLSTQFRLPHRPTVEQLRLIDLLAWTAAVFLDRQRAEAGLRGSEERYLGLYNAIDQGFCTIKVTFDPQDNPTDYQFVEVSRSFEAQTGIVDAAGKWMRDIAADQDQHWFELYGGVALTGKPARFEAFSKPLGRWWSVYAYRIGEPAERTVAVLFSDVTPRKRVEAALRESEERYRHIVEGAEDFAMVTLDQQGTIISWNSGAERLLGYVETEAVGLAGAMFFTPEDQEAGMPDHEMNCAKNDGRAANERWHVRKDSSRFWGSGLMMRLDQDGGGYLKMFRDRTAEHDAEAALTTRNRSLDLLARVAGGLLLDNSPDARVEAAFSDIAREIHADYYFNFLIDETDSSVMRLASSGGLTDAQQAKFAEIAVGEYLCGRVAATRQPVVIADVDKSDDPACAGVIGLDGKCYAGFPLITEGQLIGTISFASTVQSRFTEEQLALMHTVSDQVAAALARTRAIAALQEMTATLEQRVEARTSELVQAQDALRQSQKLEAMGQLTGGVAHDFNNLLTPIVGSLDMLQRSGLGSPREQRLIAGALQSADRAKTLVQRLLAFARRQSLQTEAVDVSALVIGMGDLVTSTTGPQIKVAVEVPSEPLVAKADANQLEMAILNLSVNARDAMPEGGTLRISAEAESVDSDHRSNLAPGDYIRISIADTGVGMDEATLARAIEPFFSTKGVGKGTGLGLSMVHGLATQLGGGLLVSSSIGLGTNAELWLPASDQLVEAVEANALIIGDPEGAGAVLVVDDEKLVRASTAEMLVDLGYEVSEAESAEAALALIEMGLTPSLVITDHLMPGMTGADLAYALREKRPGTPVLLVSGYADADTVAPDLPRLAKPFLQSDLAASIASIRVPSRSAGTGPDGSSR